MAVYKRGSRGKVVEEIQSALGIDVDGIFGKDTENAVKEFQRENGLVVDGIVGEKTLKKLNIIVSVEDYAKDLEIDNGQTEFRVFNDTRYMQKRTGGIKYIILHYTSSSRSGKGTAWATANDMVNRDKPVTTDYVVDDGTIVQFAENIETWASTAVQSLYDKSRAYGTTAGKNAENKNSISIEMCSTRSGGKYVANDPNFRFSQAVLNNTAYLCRQLISKYGIPKDHIIRHYDINGKACPGIVGWNLAEKVYDRYGNLAQYTSDNEEEYRKFVDSLYDGTKYTEPEPVYEYEDNTDEKTTVDGEESNNVKKKESSSNLPSNNVQGLSNATKKDKDEDTFTYIDEFGNVRTMQRPPFVSKKQFEELREKMTKDAPDMGRDIIYTQELKDSNILKSGQESKKERFQ